MKVGVTTGPEVAETVDVPLESPTIGGGTVKPPPVARFLCVVVVLADAVVILCACVGGGRETAKDLLGTLLDRDQ